MFGWNCCSCKRLICKMFLVISCIPSRKKGTFITGCAWTHHCRWVAYFVQSYTLQLLENRKKNECQKGESAKTHKGMHFSNLILFKKKSNSPWSSLFISYNIQLVYLLTVLEIMVDLLSNHNLGSFCCQVLNNLPEVFKIHKTDSLELEGAQSANVTPGPARRLTPGVGKLFWLMAHKGF